MTYTKINRIYNDINESSSPDPDHGTIDLQSKSVEITENGDTIITADPNYDGLSSVNLSVNVPIPPSFTIPEWDITKFIFSSREETIKNTFSSQYTINKQDGNYNSKCCYIYEYNNNIILSYGIPPIGSYYCINNNDNSNSISYDNIILSNTYVNYVYVGQRYGYTYINTFTLFGKLINLPS